MLESISAPFRKADFSKIPAVEYYRSRNGSRLAFRAYSARNSRNVIVLIHGSSGSSISMHPLAEYLHDRGMTVYALDIRGHGDSVPRGDIDYSGQLEDDMEDFVKQVLNNRKAVLVGFSQGGGFVLRCAAGKCGMLFDRFILISPFIAYNAPVTRPESDRWARVSYPRIIGLTLLGPIGGKLFGSLPVITFAVDPRTAQYQTDRYSFNLLRNFGAHYDYRSDIAAVRQPLAVLVGEKDELFYANGFRPLFDEIRPNTEVTIVPGLSHIEMTTRSEGLSAIAQAIAR